MAREIGTETETGRSDGKKPKEPANECLPRHRGHRRERRVPVRCAVTLRHPVTKTLPEPLTGESQLRVRVRGVVVDHHMQLYPWSFGRVVAENENTTPV